MFLKLLLLLLQVEREAPVCSVTSAQEQSLQQCPGVQDPKLQHYARLPFPTSKDSRSSQYYLHINYLRVGNRMSCTSTIRSHLCQGTLQPSDGIICGPCAESKRLVLKKHLRQNKTQHQEIAKFTPLSKVSKARVANALKIERIRKAKALTQLEKIKKHLEEESVLVADSTHKCLESVIENAEKNSFTEMFWTEQKKAFKLKAHGMRWHPMMIRFAILVHSQSPSTYRTLREVGVIKLPAESTLRDYTNVLHPRSGFSVEVFQELKKMAEPLASNERWVVLLHDEISIKADLVYDRVTGDLVGFVDQSQWKSSCDNLATHALVFMVVGLTSNLKMSLGYFPTTTATADAIFPIFWQAVGLLESMCNLKVKDSYHFNFSFVELHS